MIKTYLNQITTWEKKLGVNGYGETVYAVPVQIKSRIEGKRKLVRNQFGKEVISEMQAFTVDNISVDDKLNGFRVIAVKEVVDIDGKIKMRVLSL